jgi:photosystem II stability/assembly factor-like uncharacterized protein
LPTWRLVDTGTSLHFRGLAVVSKKVVWLGGYDGTVLRTLDGGASWQNVSPAGASALQFRDISAFNRNDAVAMAAGTGTDSRLYMTSDGGRTWELAYENTDPAAFFDCMSFYNPRHGLVLSDPVDGKFRVLATDNGGATWTVLPNQGMPPALDGEAGFAASGECLTTVGRDAWFGSGGASAARIFHSGDGGLTWNVQTAPVESGPTAGVFGLAFDRRGRGIAVGGDFAAPTAHDNVAAYSRFGAAWRSAATQPGGYRSGVTFLPPQSGQQTAVAVGLTGSDVTYDAGRHWTTFDTGQFDTVMCGHGGSCWASGDLGRVAILQR